MPPWGRVVTLITTVCGWGIPLGLSGADGPSGPWIPSASAVLQPTLLAPTASGFLQQQTGQQPTPDSASIRDQAEDAQGRFERIRRRLLPYASSGGSRPCEERIGRFCFWHDADDDWEPPPDPPELVEARDELLVTMADAAELIPADGWILGQRIRYMAEAGRWEGAVRLARACGGADSSWCNVLEGFALHGVGRYEAALEAFQRGLETMDPAEARRWRDPSVLLDGKGSDVLDDAADENEWEDLRARVWTLADPLYLVTGNDRESEHYARWTFSRMNDGARNAWGMRWGDDLEELTVRYGWDRGWERVRPAAGVPGGIPGVIGHPLSGGREFSPPGRVLEDPSATRRGDWVPEEKRPRSAHVPAYAPRLLPGVAQVAVFQRGDSIVVAASTELPPNSDTVPSVPGNGPPVGHDIAHDALAQTVSWPRPELLDGPEQIGLFLVDEGGRIWGTSGNVGAGGLHLTVPAGRFLLSVEAWAPQEGRGGRVRHGIAAQSIPDDLATLSDLILLHPGDASPQTLVSALPAMRSTTQLKPSDPLVLGWEVFGLGWRRENVSFELSFSKDGESFFGRIGRWLGFGDREKPLQIGWSEPAPSEVGPWFRWVEITIPEVDTGEYVLRLAVSTPGREELVRTRIVEIVP